VANFLTTAKKFDSKTKKILGEQGILAVASVEGKVKLN
jgi:hypothetical protein